MNRRLVPQGHGRLSKHDRVQKWISDYPVGKDFLVRDVAKALNLTRQDVGNYIKSIPDVEFIDKLRDGGRVWRRVAP
jgi:DNA-binding MarR family transcriptional regulator